MPDETRHESQDLEDYEVLDASDTLDGKPGDDPLDRGVATPDRWSAFFHLDSNYPTAGGLQHYSARRVPLGFALMLVGGVLSALLGIGAGIIKVLAMDQVMQLPFKVSTTTSNFMIGVTAAASAGVYLHRGYIDPVLAMPVMLGVTAGSLFGARHLVGAHDFAVSGARRTRNILTLMQSR